MQKLAIDGGKPVRDTFLAFGTPQFNDEQINEVVSTLRSGWIGTGPKTKQFEEQFAEYIGVPCAVSVSSCSAAIHLSLIVSGIEPGDEVILPPLTYAAAANVIVHCGAKPVLVDILPDTLNLDPTRLQPAISNKTKAIIPVHFGGLAADINSIKEVASEIPIIEDAAHAIGSRYNGKMAGSSGNLTCFSFYPNKNLTTAEGGMITLDDEKIADRLKRLRMQGVEQDAWNRFESQQLVHSYVVEAGYKYNLTDLHSSLGLYQLPRIEKYLSNREKIAASYDDAFDNMEGVTRQFRPADIENNRHALHLYVLVLNPDLFSKTRDEIVVALRAENIGAGIHYTPLHQEPYYRELLNLPDGSFPIAERIGANIFTLPLTPSMNEEDVQDVIAAVKKVLIAYAR